MAPLTQDNRPIKTVVTPIGPNDLIPTRFEGVEAVSTPFRVTVDFVSSEHAIAAAKVLGKPMCIQVAMEGGRARFFHGIVSRFGSRGRTNEFSFYRAELVPKLWLHSRATDCRTFENKTVLEIVEAVLREKGVVSDLQIKVTGQVPKIPYVAQYRESNLAFVQRLLEDAGLYYFHRHTQSEHTLVITDAHAGSIPEIGAPEVKVSNALTAETVEVDAVAEIAREYAVNSADVALRDHDLLRADSVGGASSTTPAANGELYDFLGDLGPNDSQNEAKRRIEAEEAEHDRFDGESTCAAFTSGCRVKVIGGPLGNAGSDLLLLSVTHRGTNGNVVSNGGPQASYRNSFTAMPAATRYRPPHATERPSVQGTQVAKIVGAGSQADIDVDANGCVLLQFPWDRGQGKDGRSKHRVHVAAVWAGAGWGFVQHPRIGQEVLVEFLEGDPDRPIVTGRVYNSSNKYPYELPANKTQSGVKTRSVGGGPANFNELRFEDKSGSEQVYLHAEKNLDTVVENDETHHVGHDRTTTVDHDETRTVKHDETVTVENDRSHTVGANATHTVGKNESITIGKTQTFAIGEHRTVDIAKDDSLTIGGKLTAAVGKKITIEAGDEIVLTCGQSSITMKKDGTITIKGKDITMNAMGKVEVKANADVAIKGTKIAAEGTAQAEFKGAMVTVEGKSMTTIKGAIAQVTGSGMLKAGGGITMLG